MMFFFNPETKKIVISSLILICLSCALVYAANKIVNGAIYADLANWAYDSNANGAILEGFNGDKWSVVDQVHSSESGLDAAVYENKNTGEIVISFAGTISNQDWLTDVENGLGLPSDQYYQALLFAQNTLLNHDGKKVTITGHSLGGGLAQYTAQSLGLNAYTYNAAEVGISQLADIGWNLVSGNGEIINFRSTMDPVSIANNITSGVSLGEEINVDTPFTLDPLEAHDMTRLADFLAEQVKNQNNGQLSEGAQPSPDGSGVRLPGSTGNNSDSDKPGTPIGPQNNEDTSKTGWVNPDKDWMNPDKDWVNPDKDWVNPDKDKVYN